MSDPSIQDLLAHAIAVAYAGGRRTLAWFNTPLEISLKADGSPVTVADRAAETLMREQIRARFPSHVIVGEEHEDQAGEADIRWILDPIDGTKTFVRGVPLYGTLVGVERAGEPIVGVIYLPALDELIAAGRGLGCTWNGRPCHVSAVDDLSDALVVASDLESVRTRLGNAAYGRLMDATKHQRTWADCYAYALIATGRAEIALDVGMQIWDCAPLLPILEEAGGRFGRWDGTTTIEGGDVVGTNGRLHEKVLAMLAG